MNPIATPDDATSDGGDRLPRDEESPLPDDIDEEAVLDEESPDGAVEPPPMYSDLVGLEATEADVLEQSIPVPPDDDENDRS